ncbi:MAG: hypothetical protein ACQETM_06530 [Bacteroidota bacterium]
MLLRTASTFILWCLAIITAPSMQAQNEDMMSGRATGQDRDHGVVNFKTTCSSMAQIKFEHGLGMLHHMMYEQAHDIFVEATDADPECAMAYWGIAMTQLNPLWAPPGDQQFEKGWQAIRKATSVGDPSANERDHIRALQAYYETARGSDYREGLKAWEQSLEELHSTYPDDVDAGAYYGLSLLATAPPDDDTYSHQRKAGALLEKLFQRAPEHPGLFHYIIHAYDNPVLAENAVDVARAYDKLAPDVPHALHMPSHIFVRIGSWPETIDWNRRSADAALRQPVDEYTSMHHAHALDYMMYAYLQRGLDDKAAEVLDELLAVDNYQPHFGAAYGVAAGHARYYLERREWGKAARLEPRIHNDFPWDDFPQYEAISYWARGMGAVRTGDLESAREAVDMLKDLRSQTLDNGEEYWALLVNVQRKTVQAWIAHEEGHNELALERMREAADLEDSVDKHPVTPSDVLPARELLGDMLLLHEKPEKAISAYETALEISPNRFNSLYGAGRAAEMAGDDEQAEMWFSKLHETTVPDKSDRPELEKAADYLANQQDSN